MISKHHNLRAVELPSSGEVLYSINTNHAYRRVLSKLLREADARGLGDEALVFVTKQGSEERSLYAGVVSRSSRLKISIGELRSEQDFYRRKF